MRFSGLGREVRIRRASLPNPDALWGPYPKPPHLGITKKKSTSERIASAETEGRPRLARRLRRLREMER